MADGTVHTVEREVTAIVTEEAGVILTLSKEETQALKDVCALIGGDIRSTRRMHTDNISKVLYDLGYRYNTQDLRGSLQFLEAGAATPEDEDGHGEADLGW